MIFYVLYRINYCKGEFTMREEVKKIKKKSLLKLSLLVGTLSIVPVFATSVNASSIMDELTETETAADFSEDTQYSLLRGNNLNSGSVRISKIASNEIAIYGVTQCHRECDEVWLDVYLEQKDNGIYYTYDYWNFYDTDETSLSASITVIVPRGHYYRVRGYHAAKDGSKEATSTITQGIWVG